jgi:hypothetical protein
MGLLKLFGAGVQTVNKRIKIAVYLWAVNLLFSLVVIAPLFFLLQKGFSRSLLEAQMAKGSDLLIWMGDFIFKNRDFYPALLGWILVPLVFYLLFNIFLSGGVIGRIASPYEKSNFAEFLSDCGKHFFRFFRVFLLSLIGFILFFGVIYRLIAAVFDLWTKNASTEWPLIFVSNIKFLIAILLFSIVRMFFDYVKVRLVIEDSKKSVRSTLLNFVFLGRRFAKAWILYILVGLVAFVFFILFVFVDGIFPKEGFFFILFFLWHQLYIFSRMWTKMLFFSTEYHLASQNPSL